MKTPAHVTERFVHPGEVQFGRGLIRMRTLLGSCVTLTVWHPRLKFGGMCHYMVPRRGGRLAGQAPNGIYGDEAVELLLAEMRAAGTKPSEYEVKIFGGGNMFPDAFSPGRSPSIAEKNMEAARTLVRQHGLCVVAEHTGGAGYRNIVFDVWSGDVWVRHCEREAAEDCDGCTRRQACEAR